MHKPFQIFFIGLFTVGRKQFSTSLIYKQFDFFLTVNIIVLSSIPQYIYQHSNFPSIFCTCCQIHCFLHAVYNIHKRLNHLSHVFASNCNSSISTLWNSINSVQKAVDLTTPAKNRRKMRIIDLNFQMNKLIGLACRVVWNWPSKSTTQSLIFREM